MRCYRSCSESPFLDILFMDFASNILKTISKSRGVSCHPSAAADPFATCAAARVAGFQVSIPRNPSHLEPFLKA